MIHVNQLMKIGLLTAIVCITTPVLHFAWAGGETVVHLQVIGPWSINYVNPADDPRNKQK